MICCMGSFIVALIGGLLIGIVIGGNFFRERDLPRAGERP